MRVVLSHCLRSFVSDAGKLKQMVTNANGKKNTAENEGRESWYQRVEVALLSGVVSKLL